MNILLVFPGYRFDSVVTFQEPLGIPYLASTLAKAGHDAEVADLTFTRAFEGLDEMARREDVVGISFSTPRQQTGEGLLGRRTAGRRR